MRQHIDTEIRKPQPTHQEKPPTRPTREFKKELKSEGRKKDDKLNSEKKKGEGNGPINLHQLAAALHKSESMTPFGVEAKAAVAAAQVEGIDEQVQLMAEKILDGIEVSKLNGDTTTRLILNPPNPCSPFNGAEIVLTQFSTAPLSYSIEFFGNEQATATFAASYASLEVALNKTAKEMRVDQIRFSYKSPKEQLKKVTQIR